MIRLTILLLTLSCASKFNLSTEKRLQCVERLIDRNVEPTKAIDVCKWGFSNI